MIPPTELSFAAWLAAGLAGVLAAFLLVTRWGSVSHRRLAVLLGATGVVNLANGSGLLDKENQLLWRQIALTVELIQPAMLIAVGMAFVTPASRRREPVVDWRAWVIGGLGLVLAGMTMLGQVFKWQLLEGDRQAIVLSPWGLVPYLFLVIAMTVGVAQLEVVLRASQEPFRHTLKFIVIGVGGLAGYQIYQASQMLLFKAWNPELVMASGIVTMMALGLIVYGLGRSRLREVIVNTYISHQALMASVSVIAIGGYLVAVGVVGTWLRQQQQPWGVGLDVVVVFAALVTLIIAVFSKTVRAEVRRLVTRNFYRTKYDYRAQWLQITEAFQVATDRDAIMDSLLNVLIRTFPTTRLSIWSFREADRRFCRIRSLGPGPEPVPVESAHPVIRQLMMDDDAVWVEQGPVAKQKGVDQRGDPILSSGAILCFPVRIEGHLMAFIALGRPLHGQAYGTDDCDLLHGISHHVGMLLSHARLAEERRASVELDAVRRFSVFCLHDLKNLAARLSLVAQNAEHHGGDPAFQESAMRTVRDTAQKMTTLMSKLSVESLKLSSARVPEMVELPVLIEAIVAPLRGGHVQWHISGGTIRPVMAVREEIHQVLLNIVLNAKQAISEQGDISIRLSESREAVTVTVEDTGCGIPEQRLESLFRPAQSSRPGGLGIGLYQCRQIVEAHQGTIQIRSEVRRGTQVQIELPVDAPSLTRSRNVKAESVVAS